MKMIQCDRIGVGCRQVCWYDGLAVVGVPANNKVTTDVTFTHPFYRLLLAGTPTTAKMV